MGCCMSTASGSNSPYSGGGGGTGSARAINESSQQQTPGIISPSQPSGVGVVDDTLPSPSSTDPRMRHHHHRHHHYGHRSNQPLSQHINKPLRRHEWSSRNRLWTRAALTHERAEFFDTRVTGRQEIWQTLRAALEVLWEADIAAAAVKQQQNQAAGDDVVACQGGSRIEVQDPAIALATAQSILTAADITLPTGDLAQGAYDSLGNYYSLPEYVVSDPLNMVVTKRPEKEEDMDDMKADLTAGEETAEDEEETDLDHLDMMDPEEREEVERRREEKGKAVADVRDQITIRARLSDGSRDVNVSVGKGETVRSIARHIADKAKLAPNKKVRIAYMGKILKENSPLLAQGWKQGHVLNALVFNR